MPDEFSTAILASNIFSLRLTLMVRAGHNVPALFLDDYFSMKKENKKKLVFGVT